MKAEIHNDMDAFHDNRPCFFKLIFGGANTEHLVIILRMCIYIYIFSLASIYKSSFFFYCFFFFVVVVLFVLICLSAGVECFIYLRALCVYIYIYIYFLLHLYINLFLFFFLVYFLFCFC
jgi:hypothetical protein